jgi:hypothetical protein
MLAQRSTICEATIELLACSVESVCGCIRHHDNGMAFSWSSQWVASMGPLVGAARELLSDEGARDACMAETVCWCIHHQLYWIAFSCWPCGEFPIDFTHNRNPWSVKWKHKISNRYQLAIQRDRYPNKLNTSLLWMRTRKSWNAMMLSISEITV